MKKQRKLMFKKITSIHGISRLAHKNNIVVATWSALFVVVAVATITFVMMVRHRYNDDGIITQINSNCRVDQVPFPAVSICNFNVISLRETRKIENILRSSNIQEDDIKMLFRALHGLGDFAVPDPSFNFPRVMAVLNQHYFNVESIMAEVHQKCENLLVYCLFNGIEKECSKLFSLIKTFDGYCCAFNYAALTDGNEDPQTDLDKDFEHYIDEDAESSDNSGIITTYRSGKSSGLSVVFNVEPENYPGWFSLHYRGAKVLISDPHDYPETTVQYKFVNTGEEVDIKVEPMIFQCESNVRRISPDKRRCWFHDEAALGHTDRYSFETCSTECKMRNYAANCGCVPFKYPREINTKTCEFEDMECLRNMTIFKPKVKSSCNPVCYMECRDKKYKILSEKVRLSREFYPSRVFSGRNFSELSSINVYFKESFCNCYKLMLLMDLNTLIANYGGILSLSFGVSIISVMELIYLCLTWLFQVLKIKITRKLFSIKAKYC